MMLILTMSDSFSSALEAAVYLAVYGALAIFAVRFFVCLVAYCFGEIVGAVRRELAPRAAVSVYNSPPPGPTRARRDFFDGTCAICLGTMYDDEEDEVDAVEDAAAAGPRRATAVRRRRRILTWVRTRCGHFFHQSCAIRLPNPERCPVCRGQSGW